MNGEASETIRNSSTKAGERGERGRLPDAVTSPSPPSACVVDIPASKYSVAFAGVSAYAECRYRTPRRAWPAWGRLEQITMFKSANEEDRNRRLEEHKVFKRTAIKV